MKGSINFMLLFLILALSSSFHVDWCALQPDCNFTHDICRDVAGTSFTRPITGYILTGPDSCNEGMKMTLIKMNAQNSRLVPSQRWLLDTTM